MAKLYAVPVTIQAFAADFCWGDKCGKGIVGGLDLDLGGGRGVSCIPCREDDCPFAKKTMAEPCGEVNGEPVYLRALKDPVP
jgi:hypothetical protein